MHWGERMGFQADVTDTALFKAEVEGSVGLNESQSTLQPLSSLALQPLLF